MVEMEKIHAMKDYSQKKIKSERETLWTIYVYYNMS